MGLSDKYNFNSTPNSFDDINTGIIDFSKNSMMHVFAFNLTQDQINDDDILIEMQADKTANNTINLDNYIEIFYVNRFMDSKEGKEKLTFYKFQHCSDENFK